MRRAGLALTLLASLAVPSEGQGKPDTAVVVQGFLEAADSGGWQLVLPVPLVVGEQRVNVLAARVDARWRRLEHHFVRAAGRVESPKTLIDVDHLAEIEPPGTVRTTARLSLNQMAIVTLSAIPNRFAWRLPSGGASGVQPLLVYTILNHGQTELDFLLPTNEVLCADVGRQDEVASWETSLPAPTRNRQRIVIRLGGMYRQFVAILPEAAPRPGRYEARVTLCGIAEYRVKVQFDVLAP